MAVSGAPEYAANHAEKVIDLGIGFLQEVHNLKLPSAVMTEIRIGVRIGNYRIGRISNIRIHLSIPIRYLSIPISSNLFNIRQFLMGTQLIVSQALESSLLNI